MVHGSSVGLATLEASSLTARSTSARVPWHLSGGELSVDETSDRIDTGQAMRTCHRAKLRAGMLVESRRAAQGVCCRFAGLQAAAVHYQANGPRP